MSESDELLIRQIRQRDAEAWRELIARFEGRLLKFVEGRVRNRAAAEDVVQETFIGLLTSLPNFDDRRPLESYLFSIAAHKLTDALRREGRRPTLPLVARSSDSDGWEPAGSAGPLAALPDRPSAGNSRTRSYGRRWPSRSTSCAAADTGSNSSAWNCCWCEAGRIRW